MRHAVSVCSANTRSTTRAPCPAQVIGKDSEQTHSLRPCHPSCRANRLEFASDCLPSIGYRLDYGKPEVIASEKSGPGKLQGSVTLAIDSRWIRANSETIGKKWLIPRSIATVQLITTVRKVPIDSNEVGWLKSH